MQIFFKGLTAMAISKAVRAALKAVTFMENDIKKDYERERQAETLAARIAKLPLAKEYTLLDLEINAADHDVPVRVFSPRPRLDAVLPVLLYFHGGGWVTGNIDTYSTVCASLAQATGRMIVSVDYRLAPEHRFPNGFNDCRAVYKKLCAEGLLGTKPEDITLIGDSAGGNLAAAVSLMVRDTGGFVPKKQILLYPALFNDHSPSSPFKSIVENGTDYVLTAKRVSDMMDLYQSSEEDLQNPYFAPLVAADFSNQPQTLIITAEFDPLRDEGEYYGEKLREAGNKVHVFRMADALHGFISLPPRFSHVKKAYSLINQFLNER